MYDIIQLYDIISCMLCQKMMTSLLYFFYYNLSLMLVLFCVGFYQYYHFWRGDAHVQFQKQKEIYFFALPFVKQISNSVK